MPSSRYNLTVYPAQVAIWMVRRALTTPWGLVWAASSLVVLPLLVLLSPPGLLEQSPAVPAQTLQVAMLSGVLGCALAVATFEESRWLFESASRGRALLGQLCGLASAAILGWILVALSAGSQFGFVALPAAGDLISGLLGIVQLTMLAALLLQFPSVPRGVTPALLLFVALVLPALLPGTHLATAGLSNLIDLDPSSHHGEESRWARLWGTSGPIVFLAALLGLLHLKRVLPPPGPDEVRRSRRHPQQSDGS